MKLCAVCLNKPWPFAIAVLIALFAAFLTWFTLEVADTSRVEKVGWSVFAFFGVGGVLVGYMVSCLRRHCRDDNHSF